MAEVSTENPYGVIPALVQGGLVAQTLAAILLIMSVASWYIMFVRWFEQRKIFADGRDVDRKVWAASGLKEGAAKLDQNSPYRQLADDAIYSFDKHQGEAAGQITPDEWVQLALNRSANLIGTHLNRGLPFLGSVGAVAPFVGLLGTVIGIYRALVNIGAAGQASIDKVAGPVGEALIMTAFGLAVAIPAVLGYNYLAGRNKDIQQRLNLFAADVHGVLISGARVSRPRVAKAAPAKPAPAASAAKK